MLIIDEISMVSGDLFDGLEHQVAQIRYSQNASRRPFGGVQIIVCGVRRCCCIVTLIGAGFFPDSPCGK